MTLADSIFKLKAQNFIENVKIKASDYVDRALEETQYEVYSLQQILD